MTALLDGRPAGLDAFVRPGNTFTLTLTWAPAGSLVGRTFVATLDAATLALGVVGDVMTVTVTEAQTAAAAANATFLLTETTGGGTQDLLVGQWSPSLQAATSSTVAVTVTESAGSVAVSVVGTDARFHRPFVHVAAAFGSRWYQARTEAGARQVRVHFWGGSITDGFPGPTLAESTSWRGRVSAALRAKYGDGGTGYVHAGAGSDLVTETGAWTASVGMGGSQHTASAAASKQWTGMRGTTIRIFYRNVISPIGSFRYRIDGGSFTTVTPPTGFGVEPGVTTVTGLADTPHTVDIEWVSGTIGIHGVEAARATGIVTANCGFGGRAMSEYGKRVERQTVIGVTNASATITSTAPGVFTSDMVGKYLSSEAAGLAATTDHKITAVASATSATISPAATATNAALLVDLHVNPGSNAAASFRTATPVFGEGLGRADLVIVGVCVNDIATAGATVQSFVSGLSNLLKGGYMSGAYNDAAHSYSPDVVLVGEHQGTFADLLGLGPALAGEAQALAAGVGGAYVDVWGIGKRSHDYWDDLGYFLDAVHPNDAGSNAYAAPVIELLTV